MPRSTYHSGDRPFRVSRSAAERAAERPEVAKPCLVGPDKRTRAVRERGVAGDLPTIVNVGRNAGPEAADTGTARLDDRVRLLLEPGVRDADTLRHRAGRSHS